MTDSSEYILWACQFQFGDTPDTGFFLTFARNREGYLAQADRHPKMQAFKARPMLAPLPAEVWFEQYGRHPQLIDIEKQMTLGRPPEFIPVQKHPSQTEPPRKSFLEITKIEVEPLDDQSYVLPSDIRNYPEKLDNFFKGLDDSSQALNYYAVIDACASPFFPESFLTNDKTTSDCLFTGQHAEYYEDDAPYLLDLSADRHTLRCLMTYIKDQEDYYFWSERAAVFLRSSKSFAAVLEHLRQFVRFQQPDGTWVFFRFYDPRVLAKYLDALDTEPEKLASFFGTADSIVDAWGVNDATSFTTYRSKKLDQDIVPAKIGYGQWEQEYFRRAARKRKYRLIIDRLRKTMPEASLYTDQQLYSWLAAAEQYDYKEMESYRLYLAACILAEGDREFPEYFERIQREHGVTNEVWMLKALEKMLKQR